MPRTKERIQNKTKIQKKIQKNKIQRVSEILGPLDFLAWNLFVLSLYFFCILSLVLGSSVLLI